MSKLIHKSSIIDMNCTIGSKTKIWHWCHVSKNVTIGNNCILGQNVFIGEGVHIGNNVKIQNNVSVFSGVEIQDDVFVGPSVVFTNVTIPRSFVNQKKIFKKTLIKQGSAIGANSTIICGIKIGKYSFIGAGSVVTKKVNDYEFGYGVPYSVKGKISKLGKIIHENKF